jgi:hypothetical protein
MEGPASQTKAQLLQVQHLMAALGFIVCLALPVMNKE